MKITVGALYIGSETKSFKDRETGEAIEWRTGLFAVPGSAAQFSVTIPKTMTDELRDLGRYSVTLDLEPDGASGGRLFKLRLLGAAPVVSAATAPQTTGARVAG